MFEKRPQLLPAKTAVAGRTFRWRKLVFPLTVVCLLAAYASARHALQLRVPRPEAHVEQSRDNLQRIALALRSYHDQHGSLPPAYVSDSEGNKLYSWRVLILPYLGEDSLFAAFDKSKAWDSPENLVLAARMPEIFSLPGNSSRGCGYYAVTGTGTAFDDDETTSLADIADGASMTISVVEIRGLTRSWAEPFDLDLDECPRVMGGRLGQLPGPHQNLTFQAAMFDGSVPSFWYPPENCFRAMATISGGEELDPIEAEMLSSRPTQDNWFAWESEQKKRSPWE